MSHIGDRAIHRTTPAETHARTAVCPDPLADRRALSNGRTFDYVRPLPSSRTCSAISSYWGPGIVALISGGLGVTETSSGPGRNMDLGTRCAEDRADDPGDTVRTCPFRGDEDRSSHASKSRATSSPATRAPSPTIGALPRMPRSSLLVAGNGPVKVEVCPGMVGSEPTKVGATSLGESPLAGADLPTQSPTTRDRPIETTTRLHLWILSCGGRPE